MGSILRRIAYQVVYWYWTIRNALSFWFRDRLPRWTRLARTTVLVVSGLVLLTIPVLFTLYASELLPSYSAESGGSPLPVRIGFGIFWFVLAVGTALVTGQKDYRERRKAHRTMKLREGPTPRPVFELLHEWLEPGTFGSPVSFRWAVHVFDQNAHRLTPAFPLPAIGTRPTNVFRVGQGVVGRAFLYDHIQVETGANLRAWRFALSHDQTRDFANLRTVAASPIKLFGSRIGVLSAASEDDNDYFSSPEGQEVMMNLADGIGVSLFEAVDRDYPVAKP